MCNTCTLQCNFRVAHIRNPIGMVVRLRRRMCQAAAARSRTCDHHGGLHGHILSAHLLNLVFPSADELSLVHCCSRDNVQDGDGLVGNQPLALYFAKAHAKLDTDFDCPLSKRMRTCSSRVILVSTGSRLQNQTVNDKGNRTSLGASLYRRFHSRGIHGGGDSK